MMKSSYTGQPGTNVRVLSPPLRPSSKDTSDSSTMPLTEPTDKHGGAAPPKSYSQPISSQTTPVNSPPRSFYDPSSQGATRPGQESKAALLNGGNGMNSASAFSSAINLGIPISDMGGISPTSMLKPTASPPEVARSANSKSRILSDLPVSDVDPLDPLGMKTVKVAAKPAATVRPQDKQQRLLQQQEFYHFQQQQMQPPKGSSQSQTLPVQNTGGLQQPRPQRQYFPPPNATSGRQLSPSPQSYSNQQQPSTQQYSAHYQPALSPTSQNTSISAQSSIINRQSGSQGSNQSMYPAQRFYADTGASGGAFPDSKLVNRGQVHPLNMTGTPKKNPNDEISPPFGGAASPSKRKAQDLLGLFRNQFFFAFLTTIILIFLMMRIAQPKHSSPLFSRFPMLRLLGGNSGETSKISAIVACADHAEKLPIVLEPLLELINLGEVIVVDWSTKQALASLTKNVHPKLVYLAIQNSPNLTSGGAFNVGSLIARYDHLLLTDCDIALAPDFTARYFPTTMVKHAAPPSGNSGSEEKPINETDPAPSSIGEKLHYVVHSGWWVHSTNRPVRSALRLDTRFRSVDLSAAILLPKVAFADVGGYDTRIRSRAESQADLEARLTRLNKNYVVDVQKDVSRDHAFRIFLVTEEEIHEAMKQEFLQQLSQMARTHLRDVMYVPWSKASGLEPVYIINKVSASEYTADRNFGIAKDIMGGHGETERERMDSDWAEMHERFNVPWVLLDSMSERQKKYLMSMLETQSKAFRGDDSQVHLFVAHLMHGLGNRLRALGSAMSFAKKTNRVLIVIWPTDSHLNAKMDDLFALDDVETNEFVVIHDLPWTWKELKTESAKRDNAWSSFRLYNYMEIEGEGALKDEEIEPDQKSIYFKSAFIVKGSSMITNWNSDSTNVQNLKPSSFVARAIADLEQAANTTLRNMVGVHIRNLPLDVDIRNVEKDKEYTEKSRTAMDFWRSKANPDAFIAEMQSIVSSDPGVVFFVAADSQTSFDKVKDAFPPGKVVAIPKNGCESRTKDCLELALADVIALSRTKLLLGSNWSSFTELAQRLGAKKSKLAGVHFGDLTPLPA